MKDKLRKLIVDDMKRNNGLMTLEDLRGYVAKERATSAREISRLRGHLHATAFVRRRVLIEMLNILEGYDLGKLEAASSERYHLMTEAMRRAFADRAEFMGDTDFVKVPVAGLIDKSYAAKLRGTINMRKSFDQR